jgi:spore maturation protein CgeB
MSGELDIVVCGLALTSTWGNGHATTYRALIKALAARGHRVRFLERDAPWYASQRDLADPAWCATHLYDSLDELRDLHAGAIRDADLVIVGSYVQEGIEVGDFVQATARGVTAFYDIDTPITLASLERDACPYLARCQVPGYALYLSFTGGPTLQRIERELGSPAARALYCCVDPAEHMPAPGAESNIDLGYMGTYSADRQPALERLLLEPARAMPAARFVVAGPQYPADIVWPANVQRIDHLAAADHRAFYAGQRFTLNLTRQAMIDAGWSPSVRLFEAAACGTPIVTDPWRGIDEFFEPDAEILVAHAGDDLRRFLREIDEDERQKIAERARHRVLANHQGDNRARDLEHYVADARRKRSRPAQRTTTAKKSPRATERAGVDRRTQ